MSFTNPANAASAGATRYIAALLTLLGDRDPLVVQRELAAWIRSFIDTVPAGRQLVPESDGKWSVAATVRHLAHTESVYAYRYRVVLAEDEPVIPGFDQDRWSAGLAADPADVESAVAHLVHTRAFNLSLLERLRPADLKRVGHHAERGVESLDQMIRLGAAHDLVHRAQLERIRSAVMEIHN